MCFPWHFHFPLLCFLGKKRIYRALHCLLFPEVDGEGEDSAINFETFFARLANVHVLLQKFWTIWQASAWLRKTSPISISLPFIYFHYSIFRLVCLFCMRLESENFIRLQRVHFIVFLLWPFFRHWKKKSEIEKEAWECLWCYALCRFLFHLHCIFFSNIVYMWCKYLKQNHFN